MRISALSINGWFAVRTLVLSIALGLMLGSCAPSGSPNNALGSAGAAPPTEISQTYPVETSAAYPATQPASSTSSPEPYPAAMRGGQRPLPGGGRLAAGLPVVGTVEAIDGNTLTLRISDYVVMVELADTAIIRRQVQVTLTDVAAGEYVIAFGTQNGDVYEATRIQAGATELRIDDIALPPTGLGDPPSNPPSVMPNPNSTEGRPNPIDLTLSPPVSGTIEQVANNTITVVGQDGNTTAVQLAPDGVVERQEEAMLSDIAVGMFVAATGAEQNGVYEATELLLLPQQP